MKKHKFLYIIMLLICSFTLFGCSSEDAPASETPIETQPPVIDYTDIKTSAKNEIISYINENLTTFSSSSLIEISSLKKDAFDKIDEGKTYKYINDYKKLYLNKINLLLTTDNYNLDIAEIEKQYNEYIKLFVEEVWN